MKIIFRLVISIAVAAGLSAGEMSYTQTTKFEGGTLVEIMQRIASMPKMSHVMSSAKEALEDQSYEIVIKGNRMVRLGKLLSTIYDLDAGTVTTIDNTKQTYSTMTFEALQQQMESMPQLGGPTDFDVVTTNTGQTRSIDGVSAKEMLIVTTAKQANALGRMVVTTHCWMLPNNPASKEMVEFHRKLSDRLTYTVTSAPGMGSTNKALSRTINEAYRGHDDTFPALMEMEITGVRPPGASDTNTPLVKELIKIDRLVQGKVDESKVDVPAGFKDENTTVR